MRIIAELPAGATTAELGQWLRDTYVLHKKYEVLWMAWEDGRCLVAVPDGVQEWVDLEGGSVQ